MAAAPNRTPPWKAAMHLVFQRRPGKFQPLSAVIPLDDERLLIADDDPAGRGVDGSAVDDEEAPGHVLGNEAQVVVVLFAVGGGRCQGVLLGLRAVIVHGGV